MTHANRSAVPRNCSHHGLRGSGCSRNRYSHQLIPADSRQCHSGCTQDRGSGAVIAALRQRLAGGGL